MLSIGLSDSIGRFLLNKSDFYYDLPQELIAQTPLDRRDASRLMVVDPARDEVHNRVFTDIVDYLEPGDLLVANNSRVLPSRLYGEKEGTGGAIEFLLLNQRGLDSWEILCRPGRKAKVGTRFLFGGGILTGTITDVVDDGDRIAHFEYEGDNFFEVLEKVGRVPLPPYIKEELKDAERYQTVYSKELGSAAAPTAGLHFTQELIDRIRGMGVGFTYVTLHVGVGTFRPVKAEDITKHHMHTEWYRIPQETADLVNATKRAGHRVICVGTTSCRTLEAACGEDGVLPAQTGSTDIFIYPGYRFKCMDALITNFHLPESTLIMLVSAFAGYDLTMRAYREAVQERYRFFSFGDAMFIV